MTAFVNLIVSFFGFFKKSGLFDIAIRSLTFSKMLVINLSILAILATYLGSIFYVLKFIYDKLNSIISYINNLTLSSDEIIGLFLSVIKSIGLWNAFADSFAIFMPVFLSFFLIFLSKIGITALKGVRESLISLFISKIR